MTQRNIFLHLVRHGRVFRFVEWTVAQVETSQLPIPRTVGALAGYARMYHHEVLHPTNERTTDDRDTV